MKAFTQSITKAEFVSELKKHQDADNFRRGAYWRDEIGKGCAVGCSLESISKIKGIEVDHAGRSLYETHLGIPEWLAYLEDSLFEGMSDARSKSWPVEFAEAINEGSDLDQAKTPFLIMLLEHTLSLIARAKFDAENFPEIAQTVARSIDAVKETIRCLREGIDLTEAASEADAAMKVASDAATYAATIADAAARVVRAASYLARAAMIAGAGAESAAGLSARSALWSTTTISGASMPVVYGHYADQLLEILRECK